MGCEVSASNRNISPERSAAVRPMGWPELVPLKQSISGYSGMTSAMNNQVSLSRTDTNYALLPVWIYNYKFKNEDYRFHINGQTGKIIGKVPISKGKVWAYGATVFGSCFAIFMLLRQLLMML